MTVNRLKQPANCVKQSGAVLITSIVLMIIFTLLGVATMRTNITDITVQNGMQNRNNAFQCAEGALRAGEIWLGQLNGAAYETDSNPVQANRQVWKVNQAAIQNPELSTTLWKDTDATWAYGGGLLDGSSVRVGCKDDPRYFIESLGAISSDSEGLDYETQAKGRSAMYRITAYSSGGDGNASVVLQTTYLQPIN